MARGDCGNPTCPGFAHFISNYGPGIEKCDECDIFDTDEDAIVAHRRAHPRCTHPEYAPRPGETPEQVAAWLASLPR